MNLAFLPFPQSVELSGYKISFCPHSNSEQGVRNIQSDLAEGIEFNFRLPNPSQVLTQALPPATANQLWDCAIVESLFDTFVELTGKPLSVAQLIRLHDQLNTTRDSILQTTPAGTLDFKSIFLYVGNRYAYLTVCELCRNAIEALVREGAAPSQSAEQGSMTLRPSNTLSYALTLKQPLISGYTELRTLNLGEVINPFALRTVLAEAERALVDLSGSVSKDFSAIISRYSQERECLLRNES